MGWFKPLVKKMLVSVSGSRSFQDILEELVQICHILQGVGTGSSEVGTSGEQAVFDLLRQSVKPPYCVFDVGSNRGQFLQLALDNVGSGDYSVHCFEPGQGTYGMLSASFQSNPRVKLNNVGIGKSCGEARLHYDAVGSGLASLTKRKLDHLGIPFEQSEPVTITTIDDYCQEYGLDHIHLLKLDIEGHELDALAGARKMFQRKAVDLVTLEFGGCNVDTRTFFQDFWYFFTEMGMDVFRITPTGYLYSIKSYSEIHEKFGVTNLVAQLKG